MYADWCSPADDSADDPSSSSSISSSEDISVRRINAEMASILVDTSGCTKKVRVYVCTADMMLLFYFHLWQPGY